MKMEQTTINERIFVEIEIGMREGKVMAAGSCRGSSADIICGGRRLCRQTCMIYYR